MSKIDDGPEPDWKPYKDLGHKYEISSDFRLRKKPDSNPKENAK